MTETTKKRNDVAKECCGRKRGHAPDCAVGLAKAATEPKLVKDMTVVASAAEDRPFATQRLPERVTFGALLDALIDDIAERVAARLGTVHGKAFAVEIDHEADGRVIADVPSMPGVTAYGATETDAVEKVATLAGEVVKDKIEHREQPVIEAPDRSKHAEYVPPVPCTGCGVDTNIEGILHSKACSIANPPAPKATVVDKGHVDAVACDAAKDAGKGSTSKKEEKAPAEEIKFEVLREAAVEFAQKEGNGKPALVALMKKYGGEGPDGVKLSLIPADKRAAFYAELKA